MEFGRQIALANTLDWAVRQAVSLADIQINSGWESFTGFDRPSASALRFRGRHVIRFGLRALSAINVVEYTLLVAEAVYAYTRGYAVAAKRLGASWIAVHAGLHFSADVATRYGLSFPGSFTLQGPAAICCSRP